MFNLNFGTFIELFDGTRIKPKPIRPNGGEHQQQKGKGAANANLAASKFWDDLSFLC
jgi:hypothetical protein